MDEYPLFREKQKPEKPVKTKRHFFPSVMGVAYLMIRLGLILGRLLQNLIFPSQVSPGVAFLCLYLRCIGIDVLVLLYCAFCEKLTFYFFGHVLGNTFKNFGLGLLLGFGMNGVCILLAWLHGDLNFSVGCFDGLYLLCALLAVCVQSGAEELVTRGYMMSALRERYPDWVAVAVNSLFFGALHLMNPGITVISFLQIVFIGVSLSLIVVYFDSLWMCIAIHTAWNFTQNFLFGLPNSGIVSERSFLLLEGAADSLFYDATFGIEGSLTGVLVAALLGVATVLLGEKKRRERSEKSLSL